MVRLKGSYIVEYTGCDVDENGNVKEVRCKYIEDSKSGGANAGIKVKGVIHWVNANDCVDVTVNRFDYLINDVEGDLMDRVNKIRRRLSARKPKIHRRKRKGIRPLPVYETGLLYGGKQFRQIRARVQRSRGAERQLQQIRQKKKNAVNFLRKALICKLF